MCFLEQDSTIEAANPLARLSTRAVHRAKSGRNFAIGVAQLSALLRGTTGFGDRPRIW